jgi:hypothetical protein
VRGKLRDKPSTAKLDRLKRELMERRRPPRRENRNATLFNQQLEDEYVLVDDEKELPVLEQRQN